MHAFVQKLKNFYSQNMNKTDSAKLAVNSVYVHISRATYIHDFVEERRHNLAHYQILSDFDSVTLSNFMASHDVAN